MNGLLPPPLLGEDAEFVAKWKAAIVSAPVDEQAIKTEMMELCFDIERKVRDCSTDLRDCNVIVARMVGRLEGMRVGNAL